MRKYLFSLTVLSAFAAYSQGIKPCSSTEAMNEWFQKHPELKQQYDQLQDQAEKTDMQLFKNGGYAKTASAAPIYTIPVVFHIMHTGGSENISDAQVQDAVNILSRDYQKLNPDTNVVVNAFKNIIGDAQIEFRLAKKDPNGNCTNGIIRHYDTKTDWVSGNLSYYAYSWPRQNYLNIYVVKSISSGAAGYTYLPGSGVPAAQDAIVILSTYVGSIGTGNVGLSRALTHEVGHWLNLPHVWGGTN
ncbi:MAG: domain containing protein, partial [Bacteroidetes bacterium]|nr:domain containing protein [Bacteroidota bacterium]